MTSNYLEYRVPSKDAGRRIRYILSGSLGLSRALIQRLRDNNRVRLNGQSVFLTEYAQAGDLLSIDLMFDEESFITPERMDLTIIAEDEDFLVINKPPGILVHPVGRHQSGTLANGVLYHWQREGIMSKFRPIHRLDRDTSGLVLIGKNQFAHQSLARQLDARTIYREYLALVEGTFSASQGSINLPIARKPGSIIERCVSPLGQEAVTHYTVLKQWDSLSLLKLNLETGRTHQIRVHLSHLGHPLLGDTLYGGDDALIKRQALHSHIFGFKHPRTGLPVQFQAELAPDIRAVLDNLV